MPLASSEGAATVRWHRVHRSVRKLAYLLALLPGGSMLGVERLLAPDAEFDGRPLIECFGQIEIDRGFRLASRPARSHLATGPRGRLVIGADVRIGFGAAIAAHAQVTIGDHVRIAPFVAILDTDFHQLDDREVLPPGLPISLGEGVRIGPGVTILGGSSIGSRATILAGSVVRGVIPADALAGGVPARTIKDRSKCWEWASKDAEGR